MMHSFEEEGLQSRRQFVEEQLLKLVTTEHEGVQRQCWKLHPDDFDKCKEPSCAFLKSCAALVGWEVWLNGVRPKGTVEALRSVEEANAHMCSGKNIAVSEQGIFYCAHCGWNDPRKSV